MITLRAKSKDGNLITFGDESEIKALQPQAIADITHAMLVRPDTKIINIVVDESTEPKDEYYIRDARQNRTDSCVWWGKNSCGYTFDLKKAGVYTKAEVIAIVSSSSDDHRGYLKEEVDKLVENHIHRDNLFGRTTSIRRLEGGE